MQKIIWNNLKPMKKIISLLLLMIFITSCSTSSEIVNDDRDERIILCEAESQKTQDRLTLANTNPNIQLDFLGTETILADISSCYLKVKITNPSDTENPTSYNLFDIVREKTEAQYTSLEELEAEVKVLREETESTEEISK